MHIHIHCCLEYTYLFKQVLAVFLSTMHFLKILENSLEVLKVPNNSFEVLKLLENKLESLKVLQNNLESMELQENSSIDGVCDLSMVVMEFMVGRDRREFMVGVFGGSIWWEYLARVFDSFVEHLMGDGKVGRGEEGETEGGRWGGRKRSVWEGVRGKGEGVRGERGGNKDEPSISAPKPVNATTEFVGNTDFASNIPTDGPTTVDVTPPMGHCGIKDSVAYGVLRHPADSQAWRSIDEKFPKIVEDPRNLRLGISADGVDVNRGNRHHNVWQVLTVIYNLPPWLCMKRKFIMLSVLISGYLTNDIDVFLEPLVDDLHTLFETGVDTYDASTKDKFNLRVVVLWIINDYPELGILCGCPYSGFKGCVVCEKETYCVRLSASSKQRLASENQEDTRGKGGKIQKQKRNTTEEKGSSSQVNEQNGAYWKKFNIWYRKLRYWRHNSVPHCIDLMHVEKNVAKSLVETLLNVLGKTKDRVNARWDLAELGVKPELFAMQEEDKTTLPPAGYTLTNAEKDIFCETLYNIRVP
ncbi:putative transposon, En/Spm-like protein [Tanacetum coccineum]